MINVAIFFVGGLIVGSFLNVLIYRLPKSQGVVRGRSRCPHCRKALAWIDLVPLLSFAFLGGRCRYCRVKISWQYPLVELAGGGLFLAAYWRIGPQGSGDLFLSIFLLTIFLTLAISDWRYLILPDELILAGAVGAGIYGLGRQVKWLEGRYAIFSSDHFFAVLFFFSALYLLWFFSRGRWLGLGDAKLMGLIALVFGFVGSVFIFYAAIVLGGIMGLGLLLAKRANLKTKLPLGSLLCLMAGWYIFNGLAVADYLHFYLIFRW